MTKIFNDPWEFAEEALAGFCDAHSDLVRQVPGGAVRRGNVRRRRLRSGVRCHGRLPQVRSRVR